jgi:putative glycosyltransferase
MNKISLVTSLYRSSAYVDEFYHQHIASLKKMNVDYEFIFVDDGYPDDAATKVETLIKTDPNVKLILLSRNFGQYPAMFAGMANADGDFIYATDSDLEEDPSNIELMYNIMLENKDTDVVYGVLKKRDGGMIRGFFGKLFYLILDNLSDVKVPHDQAWQRVMSKRYVNALLKYNEAETLPAGLMILAGFKQHPVMMDKSYKGSTSYTFRKRLKLALNSITAFSAKPLVFIGILGISITFITFVILIIALVRKVFVADFQIGWLSIITSIWLIGGLILASVGIIGIYLAKIFNQVKNRPLYIIKSIVKST